MKIERTDGGLALPCTDGGQLLSEGMSLRQYLAGQALTGAIITALEIAKINQRIATAEEIASASLDIADALIEATK